LFWLAEPEFEGWWWSSSRSKFALVNAVFSLMTAKSLLAGRHGGERIHPIQTGATPDLPLR
jgi:hypothetical protein